MGTCLNDVRALHAERPLVIMAKLAGLQLGRMHACAVLPVCHTFLPAASCSALLSTAATAPLCTCTVYTHVMCMTGAGGHGRMACICFVVLWQEADTSLWTDSQLLVAKLIALKP